MLFLFQRRGGGGVGGGGGKSVSREERGGRRRGDRDEEGGSGPKPSGQLSLFAFLENKLPTNAGALILNILVY